MIVNISSAVLAVTASAYLPDVQDNGLLLRLCFGAESSVWWALLGDRYPFKICCTA